MTDCFPTVRLAWSAAPAPAVTVTAGGGSGQGGAWLVRWSDLPVGTLGVDRRMVGRGAAADRPVCCFRPGVVPGPLQIPAYTAALARYRLGPVGRRLSAVQTGPVVDARLARDLASARRTVMLEEALHRRIGPATVHAAQLRDLRDLLSGDAGRWIGIVPAGAPLPLAGALRGFDVYADSLVSVEHLVGELQLTDAADLACYQQLFEDLDAEAVRADAAAELVQRALVYTGTETGEAVPAR